MTDKDMLCVITEHWKPHSSFQFPAQQGKSQSRRCQKQWLDSYPWLAYSPEEDGLYCKHCVFFAVGENLGFFVDKPFKYWQKGLEKSKEHSNRTYHNDALIASENFQDRMNRPVHGIDMQLDALAREQVEKNRKVLASIIEIILFCGRQGIALRGTSDDGVLSECNRSNFNALLQLCVKSGDENLKRHLETCD